MSDIRHIWFDMDGTITVPTSEFKEAHDKLLYKAYSDAVGKPVTKDLAKEFQALYKKHGSNSAVFISAGMQQGYWQSYFTHLQQAKYYKPVPDVFQTLDKLRQKVPISLFTNSTIDIIHKTLKAISVDPNWFKYILGGNDIKKPKPDLEGFRLIIDKTGLPADKILYVGDRVEVDIKPANRVGMKSCLVYSSSSEADFSFDKMADLLTLFV